MSFSYSPPSITSALFRPSLEPVKQILEVVEMKLSRAGKTGGFSGPVISPARHLQQDLLNALCLTPTGRFASLHAGNIELRMTGE